MRNFTLLKWSEMIVHLEYYIKIIFLNCSQILDDKDVTRRFRINNIQTFAKINPYICYLPLNLSPGWNHIQLNLAHYTKVSFNTCYVETIRIAVYANCRLRRIYFADRVYPDDELPSEYKLFVKKKKKSITSQENTS